MTDNHNHQSEAVILQYQDVVLPDGMTPACLDELASLFNDYGDELLLAGGEIATHRDAAVMAFEAVVRHLRRTAPLPSQRSA